MKNNIALKSAVIGFIVGLAMAFNMMAVGIGGQLFYFLSLGFILEKIPMTEETGWIIGSFFFVIVYTLYGTIIGFLIKIFSKKQ